MDRREISELAHRDHPIACPLDLSTVSEILRALCTFLPQSAIIFDLGCGRGSWLLHLAELRSDLLCLGFDVSLPFLKVGLKDIEDRQMMDRIRLQHCDLASDDKVLRDLATAAAVLCLGSSGAFGSIQNLLTTISPHMSRGAHLLLGECFWQQPPTAAVLDALGAQESDILSHDALVQLCAAHGLTVQRSWCSTADEFDAYEKSWCESLVRHSGARPEAVAVASKHAEAYERGYRGVLGFTVLLLKRE